MRFAALHLRSRALQSDSEGVTMMRAGVRAVVRNRTGMWSASFNILPKSRIRDQHDQVSSSLVSADGHSCSDPAIAHPRGQIGHMRSMVEDYHLISRRSEGVSDFPMKESRWMGDFDTTRGTDHSFWTRSLVGLPPLGHRGGDACSPSDWISIKVGRNLGQSILSQHWKNGILRLFSTNVKVDKNNSGPKDNSEEKETHKVAECTRSPPRSIEDFKHEEIEGPTVEIDDSETAKQVRESLGELTTFMARLSKGFVAVGSVQMLSTIWSSYFHNLGVIFGVCQGLAVVLSFIIAYLLRYFRSSIEFFAMMEGRSRLRVVVLSLQAIKAIALLFFRADFVVKAVACGSLLALLTDVWNFHSSTS